MKTADRMMEEVKDIKAMDCDPSVDVTRYAQKYSRGIYVLTFLTAATPH